MKDSKENLESLSKNAKISLAKLRVKDGNSLLERYPLIAKQWHPTKNGMIQPRFVNAGSSRKYWWLCQFGHEWQATVNNRAKGNTGCPKCAKELGTSFPEQAIMFYLSKHFVCQNRAIIDKYEIDVYIKDMQVGIEYDGRYYHDEHSRPKEKKKDEYLSTLGITIIRVKESDKNEITENCIAYKYSSTNYENLDWAIEEVLRKFGLSETVDVDANSTIICAQYVQNVKRNSLAMRYPELAVEWYTEANRGLTPDLILPGNKHTFFWKCKNNHVFQARVNERVRYYNQGKQFGCQYCSGHKVLIGYNDLPTTNPDIAVEWNYEKNGDLKPEMVTNGSSKKVSWKCSLCGFEWEATVHNRTIGRGCPRCKTKRISKALTERASKKETFATAYPQLVCEWGEDNEFSPYELAPHSNKRVNWICSVCGNRWTTSVNNRATGYGCKKCYLRNRKSSSCRKVECIETGEIYESVKNASEVKGICRTSISNCLLGRSHSAGGFTWRYVGNNEKRIT